MSSCPESSFGATSPVTSTCASAARSWAPFGAAAAATWWPPSEERPRGTLDDFADKFNHWAASVDGERPRLVIIESPFRSVGPPLVSYILQWRSAHPGPVVTAVIPELVDDPLRTLWLHNHRAFWLKAALLPEPGIGVADVTLHIGREA